MKKITYIFLAIFLSLSCFAEEVKEEKTSINFTDATILGVVEGLTEYLPVSSTGHLILTNNALGLDNDTVIAEKKGEDYTMKMAVDSYAVIIQIGAIFAVIFVYFSDLKSMLFGFLGKDKDGLFLARNLIVAFLPAAVIGLALNDFIDSVLFGIYPVIIALFLGGILMLYVQKKFEPSARKVGDANLANLSIGQCLTVGFLQCVAMCPGTSRSMMTILGGYIIGLNPKSAARFSFLVGLVTLSAASGYKLLKDGSTIFEAISITNMLWGIFVSFVAAVICVKLFVAFLSKWGLGLFAWYRIVFSLILFYIFCL